MHRESTNNIQIKIYRPCSENWDEMTPTEKGRFCQKCSKTVIDFTRLSDGEILDIINSQKGDNCGRFSKDQLSRPLVAPTPQSLYKMYVSGKLATVFFLFQLLITEVRAQKKVTRTAVTTPNQGTPKVIIRGTLLDFETQRPIAYRRVYLNNYQTEKLETNVTDNKGNFSMKVSAYFLNGAFLSFDPGDTAHFIPDEQLTIPVDKHIDLHIYQYPVQQMPETAIVCQEPNSNSDEIIYTTGAYPGPSYRHLTFIERLGRRVKNLFKR